ncbi:Hsp20/alpha crystallin family protein [Flavobacteriaceae bacterium]|nr:Hsp20/alpha crystallin family protein [Flavobacteriaceae bacterium]MDC1392666.1 Hsp20/alpha crystallin family protein [Flavobacteriaceae bacterium]
MNLIRKQNPFFPSLVDELFNQDRRVRTSSISSTTPAVNIIEQDTQFLIELAAPGNKKEDFEIEIEDGILSISSSSNKEDNTSEKETFTRHEFSYNSFRRSFTIPESVDVSSIEATYNEGVLLIKLLKLEEALPQPKKLITIS